MSEKESSKNGLVVSVNSGVGGSGKTTVSVLLASHLAKSFTKTTDNGLKKPLSVCVIDLDEDGNIGFIIGANKPTALNLALSDAEFNASSVTENLVYSNSLGFHALLAPQRGETVSYTTPEFYKKVIEELRGMFDIIIIDNGRTYTNGIDYNKYGILAVSEADMILFILTLSITAVRRMSTWLDKSSEIINLNKVGVVVNQSIKSVGIDTEKLSMAAKGVPLLVSIPLDTGAVMAAFNHNRPEDILTNHEVISEAYFRLAQKVVGTLTARGIKVEGSPLF